MKRVIWFFIISILLLSFCSGIYIYHNGLVFIDGNYIAKVRLDFPKEEYVGEYACVPVVASLCELGYEKISDENDIIHLQNEEQVLTVNLNELSLTCPQVPNNCIDPNPYNVYGSCIRKGHDIYVDDGTFNNTLELIGCNYAVYLDGPGCRIVQYIAKLNFEELLQEYERISSEEEGPDIVTNGRLIVNGVDITEGNYVRIHHKYQNAEIPLLAIFRALGHNAYLQYNESRDRYEAVIDGEVHYSTATENFGIPFDIGGKGCIRKIENYDLIVDAKCVISELYWGWEADLTVDYDTSTIYVDSCDPW